jgi:WD40 repeat protein
VAALPGARTASGSRDGTLRLWDTATGACLHVLEGHTAPVMLQAAAASGAHLLSAAADGTLRVWRTADGGCAHLLEVDDVVMSAAFMLGEKHIALALQDGTVRMWSMAAGAWAHTLEGHTDWVTCVAPLDASLLVSASGDNSLRVWDTATGACARVLEGHTDWVVAVAALPHADGRVVSASHDETARVWRAATGECEHILRGHTNCLMSLLLLPDGRALTAAVDDTVRVWNAAGDGGCEAVLELSEGGTAVASAGPLRLPAARGRAQRRLPSAHMSFAGTRRVLRVTGRFVTCAGLVRTYVGDDAFAALQLETPAGPVVAAAAGNTVHFFAVVNEAERPAEQYGPTAGILP